MCEYFCIRFIDFMLAGKKFTDYTNLFSPNDFKKNDNIILNYFLNMDEITKINLSEQTIFRLDEISKIKNYFIKENHAVKN